MRETPQAYLLTFAMFLAGAKVCFLATIMHHIFSFYFLKHTLMLLVILLMKYSARESPLCPRSPYIHKGHWLASTHVSDTYIALYFGLDHHLLQKYHH